MHTAVSGGILPAWLFRFAALTAVALLSLALRADFYVAHCYGCVPLDNAGSPGWLLFAWGWLGPLAGSIAWYSNLLLLSMVIRLFRGKSPSLALAATGFAVSLTALLPHFIFDFERDGQFHPQIISGPAVWLWIGAFALCAVTALVGRFAQPSARDRAAAPIRR